MLVLGGEGSGVSGVEGLGWMVRKIVEYGVDFQSLKSGDATNNEPNVTRW